ncbi:MAG: pirin family protein [Bacteroidales bacterium]
MDYNTKWILPPTDKVRGVGVHPHRGFETVTIAYHGSVAHHDSAGNSGVIREVDIPVDDCRLRCTGHRAQDKKSKSREALSAPGFLFGGPSLNYKTDHKSHAQNYEDM